MRQSQIFQLLSVSTVPWSTRYEVLNIVFLIVSNSGGWQWNTPEEEALINIFLNNEDLHGGSSNSYGLLNGFEVPTPFHEKVLHYL